MISLLLIAALYPVFLLLLLALDRITGWAIGDAFGKDTPR
jgi:hypothetical protein